MIRTLLMLALLGAAVAGVVWQRGEYGNWPWEGAPLQLTYCGRTFERAAQEQAIATADAGQDLSEAFRAPPLIGERVLVPTGHRCGTPIPTLIYRDAGEDRIQPYALVGGP